MRGGGEGSCTITLAGLEATVEPSAEQGEAHVARAREQQRTIQLN